MHSFFILYFSFWPGGTQGCIFLPWFRAKAEHHRPPFCHGKWVWREWKYACLSGQPPRGEPPMKVLGSTCSFSTGHEVLVDFPFPLLEPFWTAHWTHNACYSPLQLLFLSSKWPRPIRKHVWFVESICSYIYSPAFHTSPLNSPFLSHLLFPGVYIVILPDPISWPFIAPKVPAHSTPPTPLNSIFSSPLPRLKHPINSV